MSAEGSVAQMIERLMGRPDREAVQPDEHRDAEWEQSASRLLTSIANEQVPPF
jgi:hypothetical protein